MRVTNYNCFFPIILRELEVLAVIIIGGQSINKIRYAEDIVLITDT